MRYFIESDPSYNMNISNDMEEQIIKIMVDNKLCLAEVQTLFNGILRRLTTEMPISLDIVQI